MPDVNTFGIILGVFMFLDALYSLYRIKLKKSLNPVIKNIALLIVDAGVSIFLIYGSLIEEPISNRIFLSVVVVAIATLIFRNTEWSGKKKNSFCETAGLWGMNNLKLAALFFLIFCD